MYYTPQAMAVYSNTQRQNFRRGNCGPYANPILYTAPNFAMPNIQIKRLASASGVTVTLVDLDDNDITTLTPTSVVDWPLDALGEYEMVLLGTGNWAGAVSVQTERFYYLRIESGSFTYYTDEFYLDDNVDGFPPDCGENWVKVAWVTDGTCIVSGKTGANSAEPVHAYAKTPVYQSFFWKANVSRPEWEFDEEGEPDAHGVFVPETRRLVKRWTLEGVPISETLADALTTASLSDATGIQFTDGEGFTPIRDARTDISWENGGCLATVKFTFTTDYLVKQGCC